MSGKLYMDEHPIAGVSFLTRVGVNFTEEQKLMIEQIVKVMNNLMAFEQKMRKEIRKEHYQRRYARRRKNKPISLI